MTGDKVQHGGTVADEMSGTHPKMGPATLRLIERPESWEIELTFGGKTTSLEKPKSVALEYAAKFREMCGR